MERGGERVSERREEGRESRDRIDVWFKRRKAERIRIERLYFPPDVPTCVGRERVEWERAV